MIGEPFTIWHALAAIGLGVCIGFLLWSLRD